MNQQLNKQPVETNSSSKRTRIPIVLVALLIFIVLGVSFIALLLLKKPGQETSLTSKQNQPGFFSDLANLSSQPSTSSPEEAVTQFLNLVKENKSDQARLLVSDKANQGVDFLAPLSGKDFTFTITNVNTEVQGTVSRVTVSVTQQNRQPTHTYVLLNTTGSWLLVDQEISQIVSQPENQEAP